MGEPATEVKLFGKWSLEDIEISDIALAVSKNEIFCNISSRLFILYCYAGLYRC